MVDFHPVHPTGNIVSVHNFQAQYLVPPGVHPTWFDKFGIHRMFGRSAENVHDFGDSSRKFAYEVIVETLNNQKRNGKECLLRSICEAAETPLTHNGLVGELWDILLT